MLNTGNEEEAVKSGHEKDNIKGVDVSRSIQIIKRAIYHVETKESILNL